MNRGYRVIFCVGEQDGDAIRGLYCEQDSTLPGNQCIALRSPFALRYLISADQVNDIGVDLTQQNRTHSARAHRREELLAVCENTFRLVPFVETEIQNFL